MTNTCSLKHKQTPTVESDMGYGCQQSQTEGPCFHTQGPHPLCHCHFQDLRPACLLAAKWAFPRHRGLYCGHSSAHDQFISFAVRVHISERLQLLSSHRSFWFTLYPCLCTSLCLHSSVSQETNLGSNITLICFKG